MEQWPMPNQSQVEDNPGSDRQMMEGTPTVRVSEQEEDWVELQNLNSLLESVEVPELVKDRHQSQMDFSIPSLNLLKRSLEQPEPGNRPATLFDEQNELNQVFIHKLFCAYFAICYGDQELLARVKGKLKAEEVGEDRLDKAAYELLVKRKYEDFRNNVQDCRTLLTELVVYRALDFNVREVFNHGMQNGAQVKLRKKDALTLINYRHYEEIAMTFHQNINRGFVRLFFDKEIGIDAESLYQKYCLPFYLEVMLSENFPDDQVFSFAQLFPEEFDANDASLVFIRHNKVDLFRRVESNCHIPVQFHTSTNLFRFQICYLGQAISYEAFDVIHYLYDSYEQPIGKHHAALPPYVIESFEKSNAFFFEKFKLVDRHFSLFSVQQFEHMLKMLMGKYFSELEFENPFLYCVNPISLGILQIMIFREIANKFKSFQVKCQELEDYIERSLLKFLDLISDNEKVSFMLQEPIKQGKTSLTFLADLNLYKIIQHRTVVEVITVMFASEYSVEENPFYLVSAFKILFKENIMQSIDYEVGYRFYNQSTDLKTQKQNSMMFHIWKKCVVIRITVEFAGMIVQSIMFEMLVVLTMQKYLEFAVSVSTIRTMYNQNLIQIDPVALSMLEYNCKLASESAEYQYFLVYMTELFVMSMPVFLVKMIMELKFIHFTKRSNQFWTFQNFITFCLGGCGLSYFIYSFAYKSSIENDYIKACFHFDSFNQGSYNKLNYIIIAQESSGYILTVYETNIVGLWIFILLQLRFFEKLGALLKIIFSMFTDFFKVMLLYLCMMAIYVMIGFFIFQNTVEGFEDFNMIFQLLMNATLGQFDFDRYKGAKFVGDEGFIKIEVVGKIYLTTWLCFSNIMLINLMIALFSDTYSKLQNVSHGMYLIEIIRVFPEKLYDEYYSGMISCPYPLALLVLPFFPFYSCIESKKFNDFVLKLCHLFSVFFCFMLMELFFGIFVLPLSFLKCFLSKVLLTLNAPNGKRACDRFSKLIFFIVFGPAIMTIGFLYEWVHQLVILYKDENDLQLRHQREKLQINSKEIERLFAMNTLQTKHREHMANLSQLSIQNKQPIERLAEMTFKRVKLLVEELRSEMKIERALQSLIFGLGSKKQAKRQLDTFIKMKQFLIENSIWESGELILYPAMISALSKEVYFKRKRQALIRENSCSIIKRRYNVSTVHPFKITNVEVISEVEQVFHASIRVAAKAFIEKRQLKEEELYLKMSNQVIDKGIKFMEENIQEEKEAFAQRYRLVQ